MKSILIKTILLIYLSATVFITCKKDDPVYKANAEVFRFSPLKCGCCWGWYVKKESDTIKMDVLPQGGNLSMDITSPIPVYIELGTKKQNCVTSGEYDYYHVIKLVVLK